MNLLDALEEKKPNTLECTWFISGVECAKCSFLKDCDIELPPKEANE